MSHQTSGKNGAYYIIYVNDVVFELEATAFQESNATFRSAALAFQKGKPIPNQLTQLETSANFYVPINFFY